MRRIVVVGNGIAGLTASDTLRSAGFDGELTIIGNEGHAPYSRPALSKAALLDAKEMTSHRLPPPTHGAREMLGVSATALDPERRVVQLEDAIEVPYDGLVIASGSRARRLHSVSAGEFELTLRGLDDAHELRCRLADRPTVVVLGGGPLGMEVASGCLAVGCEVTLVSDGPPLASQLGPYLSDLLVVSAREHGLTLLHGTAVAVTDVGGHAAVELVDGTIVESELVVSALGDIPNVEWLVSSGLVRGGVVEVDSRGRARPDVVAAGDVTAYPTLGAHRRLPLWTSAIEQAKVAAVALLQGDAAPELDFQPYFWTEQFGYAVKACGPLPVVGDPDVLEEEPASGRRLLRWAHEDGAGTAVAVNYRIPVPRLRRLARDAPAFTAP